MVIMVYERAKPNDPDNDKQYLKELVNVYETQEASIDYKTKTVCIIRPTGRCIDIKFDEISYLDRANVAELIQYKGGK